MSGAAALKLCCAGVFAATMLGAGGCARDGVARLVAVSEAEMPSSFEFAVVHPHDSTPDGRRVLELDSSRGTLEIGYLDGATVTRRAVVKVGMQPVSVRAASDREAWVVDPIADSISIVDLDTATVTTTLQTAPQPTDVVFSGLPSLAYVTVAQGRALLVFDPVAPIEPLSRIALQVPPQRVERDDI
jgi:DNA-binding beta-propeller fold protein YncE